MKAIILIDEKAALLEGINIEGGEHVLEFNPADLSEEHRTELATTLTDGRFNPWRRILTPCNSHDVVFPATSCDLETLQAVLDYRIENRNRIKAEIQARRDKEIATFLGMAPEEFVSDKTDHGRICGARFNDYNIPNNVLFGGINGRIDTDRDDIRAHLLKIREVYNALEAKNKAVYADWQKLKAAKDAAQDAKLEAIERAEQEAAERKAKQIQDWVALNGTESQKARLAEGLLPHNEIIIAIRNEAFSRLNEFVRYEKLQGCDLSGNHTCDYDPDIEFTVDSAGSLTEHEYEILTRFRDLMPGAMITARIHEASCVNTDCDGDPCEAYLSRTSLHVSVTVGEFTFTREYACK